MNSGQGGCKQRIKVFVLKNRRGGGGVRVNVNEDLKFFLKFKIKIDGGLVSGSGVGGWSGSGGPGG